MRVSIVQKLVTNFILQSFKMSKLNWDIFRIKSVSVAKRQNLLVRNYLVSKKSNIAMTRSFYLKSRKLRLFSSILILYLLWWDISVQMCVHFLNGTVFLTSILDTLWLKNWVQLFFFIKYRPKPLTIAIFIDFRQPLIFWA